MDGNNNLRNLPKVDILAQSIAQEVDGVFSVHSITNSCRKIINSLRDSILLKKITILPSLDEISRLVLLDLEAESQYSLRPVINATGVVIHTNLGRAFLSEMVAENVKKIASSYSTLEYSVSDGERGSRHSHVDSLICRLTGAEAAMVVNNNAAAIMLALSTVCKGKEVVVSRGELVEIGGSFRVPEIMAMSGCHLKEVGTTNKTKLSDYRAAINENTAALLKVHTSNFKIVGFTEDVEISDLSSLAMERGLPLIFDLGSGLLMEQQSLGQIGETSILSSVKNGASIVCFSGDKLFGGPQAGIIIGKKKYIDAMKSHQLARVVRIDKLTLAALEATLRLYSDPKRAINEIPVLSALSTSLDALNAKGKKLRRRLSGVNASFKIKKSSGQVGGGSAPGESLESVVIEITSDTKNAQVVERELREYKIPIITRVNKGAVLIDLRTVKEDEFSTMVAALKEIFGEVRHE